MLLTEDINKLGEFGSDEKDDSSAPLTDQKQQPQQIEQPQENEPDSFSLYDRLDREFKQKVKNSMQVAVQKNPDQESKYQILARELNLPVGMVERNYDDLLKVQKARDPDFGKLSQENPATMNFLSDPNRAAIAHDDIDNIAGIEKKVQRFNPYEREHEPGFILDLKDTAKGGYYEMVASLYQTATASGNYDPEDGAYWISYYKKKSKEARENTPAYRKEFDEILSKEGADVQKGWSQLVSSYESFKRDEILKSLYELGQGTGNTVVEALDLAYEATLTTDRMKGMAHMGVEQLANTFPSLTLGMFGAQVMGPVGSTIGATTMGAAGSVVPAAGTVAGIGVGATVGYGVGATIGMGMGTFAGSTAIEYGAWINGELEKRGVDMTDPEQIQKAYTNKKLMAELKRQALDKGVGTATIDAFFNMLGGRFLNKARKQGASIPKKIQAFGRDAAVQTIGEPVGEFGGQVKAYEGDLSKVDMTEVAGEFFGALGPSVVDVTAISETLRTDYPADTVDATKQVAKDVKKSVDTLNKAQAFNETVEQIRNSKVHQRDPEALRPLIEETLGDHKDDSVFFQSDVWDEHHRSLNQSPSDAAAEITHDDGESYYDSKATGDQLEFNIVDYLMNVANNPEADQLLTHMKFDPDGKSLSESREFIKELPSLMKKLSEEANVEGERIDQIEMEAKEIEKEHAEQLKAIGEDPRKAVLLSSFYRAMALNHFKNKSPKEIADQFKIRLSRTLPGASESTVLNQDEIFNSDQESNNPDKLGFFSALRKEIEAMNFKQVPAKDLKNRIQNLQGVKKDELDYTGIETWLATKEGKVTKEEVLDFLDNNGLQLEQVVQGEEFKNTSKSTNQDSDEIRREDVEWSEEYLSADEADPNGDIRQDNAHYNAQEDWDNREGRYAEDWVIEKVEEIEKEVRSENPDLSEAEIEAKVEEIFIEQRTDELYEVETEYMESGDSAYSVQKFTIDGIDEDDLYITWYPEGGAEAELYINGQHDRSDTDVNALKAYAIDRAEEEGLISTRPTPAMRVQDFDWGSNNATDPEAGDHHYEVDLEFEQDWQDGRVELDGSDEDGYTLQFFDAIENYVEDKDLEAPTIEEAKQEAIDYMVENDVLAKPTEEVKAQEEEPVKDVPVEKSINEPTKKSQWGNIALEGGDNYREFLIKMPRRTTYKENFIIQNPDGSIADPEGISIPAFSSEKEAKAYLEKTKIFTEEEKQHLSIGKENLKAKEKDYTGGHFERNTLVHMRTTDRKTKDGKNVLFIEELQSDWHQSGREQGYERTLTPEETEKVKKLSDKKMALEISLEKERVRANREALESKENRKKFDKHNEGVQEKIEEAKKLSDKYKKKWEEYKKLADESEAVRDKSYDVYSKADDEFRRARRNLLDEVKEPLDIDWSDYLELSNRFRSTSLFEQDIVSKKKIADWVIEDLKKGNDYFEGAEKAVNEVINKSVIEKLKIARKKYQIYDKTSKQYHADDDVYRDHVRVRRDSKVAFETQDSYIKRHKNQLSEDNYQYFIDKNNLVKQSESKKLEKQIDALEKEINQIKPEYPVPDAPFKTSAQWMGLALKRILSVAQQEGFDMVAWGPGKVHVDRYNQARYLKSMMYWKQDGLYHINGETLNGSEIGSQGPFTEDELPSKVGKQIAEKIIKNEGHPTKSDNGESGVHILEQEDLMIGDTGHIELYDTILRNATKDVLKKLDKKSKVTVKDANETFGEPLKEKAHSYRNKDDNLTYDKFWAIDLTDKMKDKIKAGQTLFQDKGGKKRGQVSFNGNGEFDLTKLENADESTYFHEMGHIFLEIMGDLSDLEDAPQDLKEDYQAILDFIGVNDRSEIKREHHEKWAEAFEVYLYEGKAPSTRLKRAFNRFKQWMLGVYKAIAPKINLTPEVRDVMNRMFATDQEISEVERGQSAETEITDPYDVMPQKQADLYVKTMIQARSESRDSLMKKLLKSKERIQKREYKELKKKIKKEVEAQVNSDPLYKALAVLQGREKYPDGTPIEDDLRGLKINREALGGMFGYERMKNDLPTPKIYSREGGFHPEVVAQILGFLNADTFLESLANAPKRVDQIKQLTEARIQQERPDLLVSPEISQEALDSFHNEKWDRAVEIEGEFFFNEAKSRWKEGMRALGKYIPTAQMKQEAVHVVENIKVGSLKPYHYYLAAGRARKESMKHFAKGDYEAAFRANQKERMNRAIYKEATKQKKEIEKGKKFFKKLNKSDEKLKNTRDVTLVHAARAVLNAYGLDNMPERAEAYLSKLENYDPDTFANVSGIIEASTLGAQHYKEITVNDFIQLTDAIDALWSQAKNVLEVEVEGKKIKRAQVAEEISAQIEKLTGEKKAKEYNETKSQWEKGKIDLLALKGAMVKVLPFFKFMDLDSPSGPFMKYFYRSIKDGAIKAREVRKVHLEKVLEYTKAIEKNLKKYNSKIVAHELVNTENGKPFVFQNKTQLIGALLHMGNNSNKTKFLLGYKIGMLNEDRTLNDSNWQKFFDRMIKEGVITKEDLDYVQNIWDLFESLKPDAQRAHKKVYGTFFNEVTADAFETPWGEYRGGYVPAKADPYESVDASKRELKRLIEDENAMTAWPSSGIGSTKSRVENYFAPLNMDLNLIPAHLDWATRFTYIQPAVQDVARLLHHKDIKASIDSYDSRVIQHTLIPWLSRAALQQTYTKSKYRWVDKIFRGMKRNTGMNIMFASITNALQQYLGISVAGVKVKKTYLKSATTKLILNHKEIADQIASKSQMMNERTSIQLTEIGKQIEDLILDPNNYQKARDLAQKHSYFAQIGTQNFVDLVVWWASYNQSIANGLTEKQAINEADDTVIVTQGSFDPEDLSSFEVNLSFIQLFTMFQNYFQTQANLLVYEGKTIHKDQNIKNKKSRYGNLYIWGIMIPAVGAGLIIKAMGGDWDEDDDGEYLDDLMELFFIEQAKYLTAMVPGVGNVINAGINRTNNKFYDDRLSTSPVLSQVENTVNAPFSTYKAIAKDGNKKTAVRDVLTAIGLFTGIPTQNLSRPIGYVMDVNAGKANPSGPIDYTRGLITGKRGDN